MEDIVKLSGRQFWDVIGRNNSKVTILSFNICVCFLVRWHWHIIQILKNYPNKIFQKENQVIIFRYSSEYDKPIYKSEIFFMTKTEVVWKSTNVL